MKTTIGELAELVDGEILNGDPGIELNGFAALDTAGPDQVSFFGNPVYAAQLEATSAGVVFVQDADVTVPESTALIIVANPVVAFDIVIRKYGVKPPQFEPGISPAAFVDPSAQADPEDVSVMPNASVLKKVTLGRGTRVGAGTVICEGAQIGAECEIGPNVTIREGCIIGDRVIIHSGVVIGGDGYGFEFSEGRHQKIEQLGIVRVESDVEIGSNTTIDRARFGETVIGEGTKIDNQVQIGHNTVIGKHCLIVAQSGISGSVKVGDYVTFAAQCGVSGHLEIAKGVTFAARCGVIANINEPGGTYLGFPAKPIKESLRNAMRIKRLPGIMERLKKLEEKLSKEG